MRCFQVLVPALLLACQASGANLSDTHFALPQNTPGLQELLEARFPPRVYSFDPRPKINPADLIYNHDVPRPKSEATSSTSAVAQQDQDKASDAPYSVNTSASVTPQVEEFDHERDTEPGELPPSLSVREKVQPHNASKESIETVVTDLPDVVVPTSYEEDGEERPRAIVDVRREGLSGEVSYIIHPDNQPPPTYVPLKDLPPLAHPAAQWRPDIFMKVCCSSPPSTSHPADPVASASLEVKSGYAQVGTSVPDEGEPTEGTPEVGYEGKETADESDEISHDGDDPADANSEAEWMTTTVPEVSDDASTQRSSRNSTEITLSNGTDASGNHTPRYEESGSTTYQDVANFLKDIANSDGFKNAFLGDLINNFGNLDQNAMKLIYSLLIRPLEGVQGASGKEDNVRTVSEPRPGPPSSMPAGPHGSMVLERKRLRLRDPPVNGFEPFRSIFPPSRSPGSQRTSIHPSYPVGQVHYTANSEDAWHPSRTGARLPAHGRRGDESVDVITAPPFQTFEVVLGSSINHDDKNAGSSIQIQHNGPPLPFDKLTLGLEMPPPDALDALPPGSVLIPPSYILGRPKLPLIHNKKNGAPSIEMPLSEFLPNLPFFSNKSPRFHPPAKPQAQDIPPRLPSFLSSLLPNAPPPRPVRPPGPMISPPRASSSLGLADSRPGFHGMTRPTGPPPPITKLTPPGQRVPPVPTAPVPQQVFEQDGPGSSMARPDSTFGPVSSTVFGTLHHQPHHAPDTVWAPPINEAPAQAGMVHLGDQEYQASLQTPLKDVHGEEEIGSSGGAMNLPEGSIPDRNVGTRPQSGAFIPDNAQNEQQRPPESVNYHDLPPEYGNYYDLDYRDYYHDQNRGSNGDGVSIEGSPAATGQASHQDTVDPPITMSTSPPPPSLGIHLHEGEGHHIDLENLPESHFPSSHNGHRPSLDDLLGVRKPEPQPPTLTEQEKNELQMLLQNHRMANILAEGNGTVVDLLSAHNDDSMEDVLPANEDVLPANEDGTSTPATFQGEMSTTDNGHYHVPLTGHRGGSQAHLPSPEHDTVFSEHDASIAHLWKNIQLIPLVPELFETPNHDSDDAMNLASLFDGAVPLSPGSIHETMSDNSDLERVVIDSTDGHVTMPEEVLEDTEKANAKFMAYVLIGACCGLALLSIAGVIVIVRFKKTCGSRQIKTRTRLTEQDSIENISRRVDNLALGGESGHKLGSWFTGRNEHIGSGKLRGNMALPEVQDLKREKSSKSGSARDLLSICSESSRSSSPRQARHDGEGTARTDDEEPRSSWLHDEYRGSVSDLSQAPGQDPAYSSQQYQQSHSSPHASTAKPHPADHHRYHPESSVEAELVERSVRERRYTGHSRTETDKLQRSASRRGPRYISSIDSEEIEERLVDRDQHYITDSELDDGMTHYDDDGSREPSRYFSDSRELDDVVASRRVDPSMMTSQELGEHLSRDLKHYQSRKMATTQQQQQGDGRDTACLPESSQEGEGGSRELQRSQSQVSFSRDNVQNEVFLEFDNIFRQHGQFLNSEPPASTLGRISRGTDDTHLSVSRADTPDSIDLPEEYPPESHNHDDSQPPPSSPPTTPPRFSPPPAPPRPPKPGHLSQPGTPSPQANRAHSSPSVESSAVPRSNQQRPVYWTNDEERLV